jgi:hypothetical protein
MHLNGDPSIVSNKVLPLLLFLGRWRIEAKWVAINICGPGHLFEIVRARKHNLGWNDKCDFIG